MKINPVTMSVPMGNRIAPTSPRENAPGVFTDLLLKNLQDVNRLQLQADDAAKQMVLGEVDDIHQVMLATEKAKLAMQLTVQVRNKLVESYQEIARMQF